MVEIDPFVGDAELGQALALGGAVLLVGGATRVTDARLAHSAHASVDPRRPKFSPYEEIATLQVQAMASRSLRLRVYVTGSSGHSLVIRASAEDRVQFSPP